MVGDCFSFGSCHFSVGVAAGWWVTVCHLGCVCDFIVGVSAGWWATVSHLGQVTLVLVRLPVGG